MPCAKRSWRVRVSLTEFEFMCASFRLFVERSSPSPPGRPHFAPAGPRWRNARGSLAPGHGLLRLRDG